MSAHIDIIHHAGLISEDLDGTVAQYERLGFAFTPLSHAKITLKESQEPVYIGLGNRNAIFERNYLEIVGIPDPQIWAGFPLHLRGPFNIDERLERYRGMHIMHFGTEDIEALRARYVAQSEPISEVARLQRMVETPEGQRLLQARTLYYPAGANPEALIQIAQHVTPRYALQPRYMTHANGARQMTEVIVCSDAPEAVAAKYSRYTGDPVIRSGELRYLDLGHTRVLVVDPAGLRSLVPGYTPPSLPFVAGFTVAVSDLAQTERYLRQQDVEFARQDGRLIVSPQHGCGSAVLFERLGAKRGGTV